MSYTFIPLCLSQSFYSRTIFFFYYTWIQYIFSQITFFCPLNTVRKLQRDYLDESVITYKLFQNNHRYAQRCDSYINPSSLYSNKSWKQLKCQQKEVGEINDCVSIQYIVSGMENNIILRRLLGKNDLTGQWILQNKFKVTEMWINSSRNQSHFGKGVAAS